MDLTHRFTVPAPIDVAWEAFNDLERIAPCFPGASLTSFDGEKFEGLVKVKLGPISLTYTGTGHFVERDEVAKKAVIEAKGKDKRGNGTAAAAVTAQLTAGSETETQVEVVTDLNVTGRPAQFGRGVMQDVSDKLLAQFVTCLETRLIGTGTEDTGTEAAMAPPSAAAVAADDGLAGTDDKTPIAEEAERAAKSGGANGSSDTSATSAPTATPTAARTTPPTSRPPVEPTPAAELDLGATVLPVLVKRYAGQLAVAVLVVLLLRKVFGRSN